MLAPPSMVKAVTTGGSASAWAGRTVNGPLHDIVLLIGLGRGIVRVDHRIELEVAG